MGLGINIELRKVKVRISFLDLMKSVIEVVRIGSLELLKEGIRVAIFTDR